MRKIGLAKHLMPHQISIAIAVGYGGLVSLVSEDFALRAVSPSLAAGEPNHATFVYFPVVAIYFASLVARKECNDRYAVFFPLLLAQALCLSLSVHTSSLALDPFSFDVFPTFITSAALIACGRYTLGGFKSRPGLLCLIGGGLGAFVYIVMCFAIDSQSYVATAFVAAELASLLVVKLVLDPVAGGLPSQHAAAATEPAKNGWAW